MILYIILSLVLTMGVVWLLWLEDEEADRLNSASKWGYHFRQYGSRHGKCWVTESALWRIIPMLPFINIITALLFFYLWLSKFQK